MTYEKTGYAGSNAVYLGRGKFDDYYDDHHHCHTPERGGIQFDLRVFPLLWGSAVADPAVDPKPSMTSVR